MSAWKLEAQVDDVCYEMECQHSKGNFFEYEDYSKSLLAEIQCLPRFAHISVSRELALWLYS